MKSTYDFEENNKKYNLDTFFNLDIIIPKTCYFKGELIKGKIKLIPKDIVKKSFLQCAIIGNAILEENYNYKIRNTITNEEIILFKYPTEFPKFDGEKIINGMEIPFEYEVPKNSYPSCLIDDDTYVRHILTFDFSMIEAKKSILIIIKNDQYFTGFNELYKAPVEGFIRKRKHKYAVFYVGDMCATIKLAKNAFAYNEPIPFTLNIDSSTLTIKIQKVYISIVLSIRRNNKTDHKTIVYKNENTITEKTISLIEDRKEYYLEDIIQMPKNNPGNIYKKLDLDNRKYSQKFKNINLYPSCYDGLISCEYFLRVMLETDTLFSTNEYEDIPIDFYENEKDDKIDDSNFGIKNINTSTPIGNNIKKPFGNQFDKPLMHSNTTKIKESNSDIILTNKNSNNNDNKINEAPKNEIKINNDNNEANKIEETTDGFDVPPIVVKPKDKK
jgi:hypothetical protein